MDIRLQLLESFTAHDSDGTPYKVCGYERMARDDTLHDGHEHWEPTGVFEYRLAGASDPVELRADGTMRVVTTGVRLTRH